jgi:hypothetical protein
MFCNLTYRKLSLVIASTTAIGIAALASTTASALPTISPAARALPPGFAARTLAPLPRGGGGSPPAVRGLPPGFAARTLTPVPRGGGIPPAVRGTLGPGAFSPLPRGGSGGAGSGGEIWHPDAYRFGANLGGPVYDGYDDVCLVRVHVSHGWRDRTPRWINICD